MLLCISSFKFLLKTKLLDYDIAVQLMGRAEARAASIGDQIPHQQRFSLPFSFLPFSVDRTVLSLATNNYKRKHPREHKLNIPADAAECV